MSSVAKPVMRGLLHKQIGRNLAIGISLAVACGVSYKVLVGDNRKRVYAEFYRTYDIEKEFKTMREKGVFDSCK